MNQPAPRSSTPRRIVWYPDIRSGSRVVRPVQLAMLLCMAALVAAGCGLGLGPGSMGLDEEVVCTVDGERLASADVRDLADALADAFEEAVDGLDADELELRRYRGDLAGVEAAALMLLVDLRLLEREAASREVEVGDDEVDEEIEDVAEALGIDADELVDAFDDAGLDEDALRTIVLRSVLAEEVYSELPRSERREFDSAEEFVADGLRSPAEEDGLVTCGEDVRWEARTEPTTFTHDEHGTLTLSALLEVIAGASAADTGGAPGPDGSEPPAQPDPAGLDPAEVAAAYDTRAANMMSSMAAVYLRMIRVLGRFEDGQISLERTTQSLREQQADLEALAGRARALPIPDGHLNRNHRDFVAGVERSAAAIGHLAQLSSGLSEARIDELEQSFNRELDAAVEALTRWGDGLDDDPLGRSFPKTTAQAERFERLVEEATGG